MKSYLFIVFITLTAFVNSCSKSGIDFKDGNVQIALNKCADGKFSGEKLNFCFISFISDSRCPANAFCIWQGAATAKFSLTKDHETRTFVLSTLDMPPTYKKDTVLMGYKIGFVNLTPYPGTAPSPVPADQIKAELKITKQ